MKLDFSTDDAITPGAVELGYPRLLEDGEIRRAHAVCPLTAIQNRYSMMARWHEALFPVLEELGIGYVASSPMANGLLTCAYGRSAAEGFDAATDYRASMPQFTREAYEKNDALFEFLHRIAAGTASRRARSRSRGCSGRGPGSSRSPEPAGPSACARTSPRPPPARRTAGSSCGLPRGARPQVLLAKR